MSDFYDLLLAKTLSGGGGGGGGGGSTGWVRPAEWPDYDSLRLSETQEESLYLTYDNRIKGTWIAVNISGKYTVQRVSISGGNVTVLSSENKNAGHFTETIPSDAGDWVSYRIIPQTGQHLTSISMTTIAGNNSGNPYYTQFCVERYGYLPNVTTIGQGYAYSSWSVLTVRSDTLLGLPSGSLIKFDTYANALENLKVDTDVFVTPNMQNASLKEIDFTRIKLQTGITSFSGVWQKMTAIEDFDLSGSTAGAVTTLLNMCADNYSMRTFKFPDADYSGVTSTQAAFSNCKNLEVIDLPASMSHSLDATFAYQCTSLRAIVIRSSSIVGLANAVNVVPVVMLQKGGPRIFVPSDLVSSYQAASNWSTLFASYPNMFGAIEGSEFE